MSDIKDILLKKAKEKASAGSEKSIKKIPLKALEENPYQPRMEMEKRRLEELAASIKEHGLMQPIVVTPVGEGKYRIVAGHRRAAAHELLGKKEIEAIVVRNQGDRKLASKAIVENLQREDLNVVETALALKRYKEEFQKTIEEVAKEIGKDKTDVSRILNLLNLPEEIIEDIRVNKSTKDVRALSDINALKRKLEKLEISNSEIENIQKSLYYGLLRHGHKWLKEEIKRFLSKKEKKEKGIKIKKEKKRVVFSISSIRHPIDDEAIEEIREAIEKILSKRAKKD